MRLSAPGPWVHMKHVAQQTVLQAYIALSHMLNLFYYADNIRMLSGFCGI